jgi:hypothetical protein
VRNAASIPEFNLNIFDQRARWRAHHRAMETGAGDPSSGAARSARLDRLFHALLTAAALPLRLLGLYGWGRRNALDLKLTRMALEIADLPADLEGFRILHLSDLHVDYLPEATTVATAMVAGIEADLCVFTGDFQGDPEGPVRAIQPAIEELVAAISSRYGVFAVLGNHDCAELVEPLEAAGLTVLLNETRTIAVGETNLQVCGTDDVRRFYSEAAPLAMRNAPPGLRIALVHSADLAQEAAAAGFRLYLAGHTHAGQICLPGGQVVITRQDCSRRFAAGLWQEGAMTGYTTSGVGTAVLPMRFNTRGEVALLELRRG